MMLIPYLASAPNARTRTPPQCSALKSSLESNGVKDMSSKGFQVTFPIVSLAFHQVIISPAPKLFYKRRSARRASLSRGDRVSYAPSFDAQLHQPQDPSLWRTYTYPLVFVHKRWYMRRNAPRISPGSYTITELHLHHHMMLVAKSLYHARHLTS